MMPVRSDLLALTPDDLATLSNRGTVKRAQREMEEGALTSEMEDQPDGELVFRWSDGVICRFPAGKSIHDAVCSSGVIGISRHVIRSVLAYQKLKSPQGAMSEIPSQTSSPEAAKESRASDLPPTLSVGADWNPGDISDDQLIGLYRQPAITLARKRFEEGVLVELTRGAKPVARFLDEGWTVRFPVPNDLRYANADCAESLLPTWVPLAVWAFRELPREKVGGLLSTQRTELPVPESALNALSDLLRELCRDGVNGVAATWASRLERVESSLREQGLIWPAELLRDLQHQYQMYNQHDARFEPQQLVQLVGELVARSRAIRNRSQAVPQWLVRGSRSDRSTEIAGGRLVGVGLGIQPGPKHTKVRAYLQDSDSGSLMAVERTFSDAATNVGEPLRSFNELAQTVLVRGVSLAGLASSQLLLKSGKRTPAGELILPRTASSMTIHPQSYQWENLKAPFAVENFAQLTARFGSLPPRCLRPRRCTENLHVVQVAGADQVVFQVSLQTLTARLRDVHGQEMCMRHPYHSRGRHALNELQEILSKRGSEVRFVCGHVLATGSGLEILPVCVVLDDGQRRMGIQPWLSCLQPLIAKDVEQDASLDAEGPMMTPIQDYLSQLETELSEVLLTGVARAEPARWELLLRTSNQLGFSRSSSPIEEILASLLNRPNNFQWNPESAICQIEELCLRNRLHGE